MANRTYDDGYGSAVRPRNRNFPIYPYNYYGGQGQYPQYRGLTSGINMLNTDAVSKGWTNMLQSFKEVQQMDYEDEVARQNKFREITAVSLKDVKGRWRDEAVVKRDAFISDATKIASETQGKLTWEQEKKLLGKKEGLEQFAGMSKEVEEWYGQAVQTAMSMKDPIAQRKTLENIKKIMSSEGNLESVYDATQKGDWLVTGDDLYTVNKDVLPRIPSGRTSMGKPHLTKIAGGIQALLDADDPVIVWHRDDWLAKNQDKEEKDYVKYATELKLNWMNDKPADEFTYFPPYQKAGEGDTRDVVRQEDDGSYQYRFLNKGKGLPTVTVTGVDGNEYTGASVVAEMDDPETGERVYKVVHTMTNKSVTAYKEAQKEYFINEVRAGVEKQGGTITDEEAWKIAEPEYKEWVTYEILKFIKDNKDGTHQGTVYVPVEKYRNAISGLVINQPAKKSTGEFDTDIDPN